MRYLFCFLLLRVAVTATAQPFHAEIQAFLRDDSLSPKKPGQVLFVGSSSFRLWHDVQSYFPDIPIINRGFGGSTLPDVIYYESQIIRPYQPKKIVMYCGENDFASSDTVTAQLVLERFKRLYGLIRADFPKTPIIYVAMKPSPSRRHLMSKIADGNQLIQRFLRKQRHTVFVDVYHQMLDAKGEPRPELFVEDQLHMNRTGYLIWQKALKPVLAR